MGAPRQGGRRPPRRPGLATICSGAAWSRSASASIVLILVLLAFKGCLNARKERSFENYARDLEGIVAQSQQLSKEFFTRLSDPAART